MNWLKRFKNRTSVKLSNLGIRGSIAKNLKYARMLDRLAYTHEPHHLIGPEKYYTHSGLPEVNERFCVKFEDIAKRLARKNPDKKVKVLDVGAGEGIFGIDLQDKLGRSTVEYHATGLTQPYEKTSTRAKVTGKKLAERTQEPWNRFASYFTQQRIYQVPARSGDV